MIHFITTVIVPNLLAAGLFLFLGGMFVGLFASVDKDRIGENVASGSIIAGIILLLIRGIVYVITWR